MQKIHNLVDYLRYGFGGIMDAIGALSRISFIKISTPLSDYLLQLEVV
jgi:hypothetical protein